MLQLIELALQLQPVSRRTLFAVLLVLRVGLLDTPCFHLALLLLGLLQLLRERTFTRRSNSLLSLDLIQNTFQFSLEIIILE